MAVQASAIEDTSVSTAPGSTLVGVEDSWEVLDVPQAVAAQGQAGAGEAQAIILQVQ